ncbi:MAG: translation initiation factor IF-2 N-terminal domain-containing protein, partial [Candidatus Omnitrophica bacterium]|nr:translation initiation factor IF-2 N-terminal domain-containing protein [Candidatus Omnitrophota bacterium]
MSAISEDDVARVKNLLNPPTAEAVVEQRLRPTLIRRRRKEKEEQPPVAPVVSTVDEATDVLQVPSEDVHPIAPEEAKPHVEAETVAETGQTIPAEAEKKPLFPSEPDTEKDAAAQKQEEPKPSAVKIISTKIVLPEEEEEEKKVIAKKKKRGRERFFPAEDIPIKKHIPLSSKELEEQEFVPQFEEPAKVTKIFPPRKKKSLTLVKAKKTAITVPKAIKRKIKMVDTITVGQLAKRMSVKAAEVIKKLMQLGVMASLNESIDVDTATLAAHEFGYEVESVK